MKPRTKKILITGFTSLFLLKIADVRLNRDYHLTKSWNLPAQAQYAFWNNIHSDSSFDTVTGAYDFYDTDGFVHFSINLDDQYYAIYSNDPRRDKRQTFNISIYNVAYNPSKITYQEYLDEGNPCISFNLQSKDFKIVSTSTENTEQMSKQEIDRLKKLAVQRFKEVQNDYYQNR